ncbi:hypothetical protein VTL71DRAFT_14295 [Oculimacula yallundae]|uniref:Uncharacterized protein n=1 Tax=Oculimacula yallundae TaxID=86028 RepID=A0ABR4CK68_9HELO
MLVCLMHGRLGRELEACFRTLLDPSQARERRMQKALQSTNDERLMNQDVSAHAVWESVPAYPVADTLVLKTSWELAKKKARGGRVAEPASAASEGQWVTSGISL